MYQNVKWMGFHTLQQSQNQNQNTRDDNGIKGLYNRVLLRILTFCLMKIK